MAGSTTTTFDSALKEDYQPGIRSQLNNKTKMLAQVQRNTESFEGRRAILSLEVGRSMGVGARKEGDTLPTARAADFGEQRISTRQQTGRIQVSQHLISSSKSDSGSFARGIKAEMKSMTDALERNVNRQIWGTSNGVIAQCAVATSTTVPLATTTTSVQIQQFEQGMVVDIATVAQAGALTGGKVHGAVISGIDETAGAMTITIDTSITSAATDFVFTNGAGGITTNQRELTGLQTIVAASGSLFNIDPATDLQWKSTVSTAAANRAISESLIEQQIQTIGRRGDGKTDLIVGSDGVFRAVGNIYRSIKRFTDNTKVKGGISAVAINAGEGDVNMIWERDCPSNTLWGFDTSHLIEFVLEDWAWMDKDGAVLSRVSGQTAYEAVFYKLHELATDQRNAHWLIDHVTES